MWHWSSCYQLDIFGFQLGFLKLARLWTFYVKHLYGAFAKTWLCVISH